MFEAAVSSLVKSLDDGGDGLSPCASVDSAAACAPLRLAVKRNRRWFWKKPVKTPLPTSLQDVLLDCTAPLDSPVTERDLVTYNVTSTFSAGGTVGASLADVIGLQLSASDTVSLNANLGKLSRRAVDENKLLDVLQNRKLNLEHPVIEEIRQDPKKVVCVITEAVTNTADSTLSIRAVCSGKGTTNPESPSQKSDSASADLSSDQTRQLSLPAGTVLAYRARELRVSEDGRIILLLDPGAQGGFHEEYETLQKDLTLVEMYSGILDLPADKRSKLTNDVLKICENPRDISPLLFIIKSACENIQHKTQPLVNPNDVIKKMATSSAFWKDLLQLLTFQIKDDGSLVLPSDASDLMESSHCLFEALDQLADHQMACLVALNQNTAKPVLAVLQKSLACSISKQELGSDFGSGTASLAFLESLGYVMTDGRLCWPQHGCVYELEAAYRAVFALWLHSEDLIDQSNESWCIVL